LGHDRTGRRVVTLPFDAATRCRVPDISVRRMAHRRSRQDPAVIGSRQVMARAGSSEGLEVLSKNMKATFDGTTIAESDEIGRASCRERV
jgi:hypothetical protein